MSLVPLFAVACAVHCALFMYVARQGFVDLVGRLIVTGFGTAGALFLMLAFWWYCERLQPQLEREVWPLVWFVVDSTTEYGSELIVYAMHNNSVPVYWPRLCQRNGHGNCMWLWRPAGTRIGLFQNPLDLMQVTDDNRVTESWPVVLITMPTLGAWLIAVGLNYIYTHDMNVTGVVSNAWHYVRPPPAQAPPVGYVHRDRLPNEQDTTSTSTSSEPPAYTLMDVPDEPAAME